MHVQLLLEIVIGWYVTLTKGHMIRTTSLCLLILFLLYVLNSFSRLKPDERVKWSRHNFDIIVSMFASAVHLRVFDRWMPTNDVRCLRRSVTPTRTTVGGVVLRTTRSTDRHSNFPTKRRVQTCSLKPLQLWLRLILCSATAVSISTTTPQTIFRSSATSFSNCCQVSRPFKCRIVNALWGTIITVICN